MDKFSNVAKIIISMAMAFGMAYPAPGNAGSLNHLLKRAPKVPYPCGDALNLASEPWDLRRERPVDRVIWDPQRQRDGRSPIFPNQVFVSNIGDALPENLSPATRYVFMANPMAFTVTNYPYAKGSVFVSFSFNSRTQSTGGSRGWVDRRIDFPANLNIGPQTTTIAVLDLSANGQGRAGGLWHLIHRNPERFPYVVEGAEGQMSLPTDHLPKLMQDLNANGYNIMPRR
jgi:hypothetical protein